jgi:anti-sigma B factor antagonist
MERYDPPVGRVVGVSRDAGGAVVITVEGEQDISTADRLLEALEQADAPDTTLVRIDATRVTLLDSTSVGVLLFFARRLAERGAELELEYSTPGVGRVVDVSGLGRAIRLMRRA